MGCSALVALALAVTAPAQAQGPSFCASAAYRQLEFWIGHWEVRLPNGTLAGTDLVERSLDGCVVLEHWTDVRGETGESLFYFHTASNTWKQVWTTRYGIVKEKQSTTPPRPGAMRFVGHAFLPDGRSVPDRTTLYPEADGTVRQVIEQSKDGGQTWTTTFDAIYSRRGSPWRLPQLNRELH